MSTIETLTVFPSRAAFDRFAKLDVCQFENVTRLRPVKKVSASIFQAKAQETLVALSKK